MAGKTVLLALAASVGARAARLETDIRNTTGKPCAAATVLPFEATRPFDPEAELLRPNEACPGRIDSVHRVPKRASEILTIGYLYYRDAKALAEKVEYWKTFDESLLAKTHFLVVDDGSPPDEAAAPVSPARKSKARKVSPKARPPQVVEAGAAGSAARVTVVAIDQDLVWNIAGARNLIFAVAPTDVVLLMDMDYGVPSGLVVWALGQVPSVARSCVVLGGFPRDFRFEHERRASRHTGKRHPGVQLMSRRAYWHVGGNDEDLVGHYGHTDPTSSPARKSNSRAPSSARSRVEVVPGPSDRDRSGQAATSQVPPEGGAFDVRRPGGPQLRAQADAREGRERGRPPPTRREAQRWNRGKEGGRITPLGDGRAPLLVARRVPCRVLTARTHLPRLRDARALTRRAAPPSPPSAETTKNQHIINLWIAAACCWAYGVVANNGACRRKGI